jgi:hypothetical protein
MWTKEIKHLINGQRYDTINKDGYFCRLIWNDGKWYRRDKEVKGIIFFWLQNTQGGQNAFD